MRHWAALLAIFFGCGGSKVEPQAPAESPVVDAGGAESTPAVDAAPTPTSIACRIAGSTCTEYREAPPERAEEIRDQCAKGRGEVLETCPTEKLAGTCTVSKPPMVVVSSLYRGKDGKKVTSMIASARRSCEANGGTFAPARR